MGLHRGHKARPLEWVAEKLIFIISLTAILMVFLIFIFVAREALPIFTGTMTSAAVQPVIPPSDIDKIKPEELGRYLGLSQEELAAMDRETRVALMEVRQAGADELPAEIRADKDASLNTLSWRYILGAHQWSGYQKPEYIWQPISSIHKYNIIPLIIEIGRAHV